MKLIPAIDIRNSHCVRLKQGDPNRQTNYDMSPLEIAETYLKAGVQQIHIVDLDGAFSGESKNTRIIKEIVNQVPVKIELGGGIRTLSQIEFWLKNGIHQVILGTVALEDPEIVKQALNQFGDDKIIVGIDAKNGKVAIHGWQTISRKSAADFSKNLKEFGVKHFIFTDIKTDGMFSGPNIKALLEFANSVQAQITASGGISTLDDLIAIKNMGCPFVDSVIVGRAIYENRIDVKEAVKVLSESN